MEIYSVLCGKLDGRGVWGRINACVCMAKSLCCSPETIMTLLISYTQNKIKSLKKVQAIVSIFFSLMTLRQYLLGWTIWNCQYSTFYNHKNSFVILFNLIKALKPLIKMWEMSPSYTQMFCHFWMILLLKWINGIDLIGSFVEAF